MKKILYILIIIAFLLSVVIMLSRNFFQVRPEEAKIIALTVIEEKYITTCGGNFEKYLTQKVDEYTGNYSFYSDNGKCSLFIDVGMYGGWHESGIMPNN